MEVMHFGMPRSCKLNVAGLGGFEPPVSVLETDGLPLTDSPILKTFYILQQMKFVDNYSWAVAGDWKSYIFKTQKGFLIAILVYSILCEVYAFYSFCRIC